MVDKTYKWRKLGGDWRLSVGNETPLKKKKKQPLLVDHFSFSKCLHAFLYCSHEIQSEDKVLILVTVHTGPLSSTTGSRRLLRP